MATNEERLLELEREWQKNNSILQMMVKSMSAKEWEKTRKEWLVPLEKEISRLRESPR